MKYERISSNVISFLGGVGVGALMEYLFDPEEGLSRRRYLKESAGEKLHDTGESISSALHRAGEQSSWLGRKAGIKAGLISGGITGGTSLAEDIGVSEQEISNRPMMKQRLRNIGQRLSRLGEEKAEQARYFLPSSQKSYTQRAKAYLPFRPKSFGERIRSYFPRMHEETYIERAGIDTGLKQTLAAVGCVALGMGLMYLLDPTAGRRRRVVMRDKMRSGMTTATDRLSKRGRDLYNRASGTVAEVRGRMSHEPVSDRVLVDRVRSEMGRCLSNPGAIDVCANQGAVTVSGPIMADEVDGFLKCVWSTPGVKEIYNRLDIHSTPDIPALQGATAGSRTEETIGTSAEMAAMPEEKRS